MLVDKPDSYHCSICGLDLECGETTVCNFCEHKMADKMSVELQAITIRDNALDRFQELAKPKYDKGQLEHGGLIIDRNVLNDIEEEVIDLWFYVQALKIKLNQEK